MANICFDCKKCLGKCSWSRDFIPVAGWDATPAPMGSYNITYCPQFEFDEPRPYRGGILSEEQNEEFLEAMEHEQMVRRRHNGRAEMSSSWGLVTNPRQSKRRRRKKI